MVSQWTQDFSYIAGAVRYADLAYLALVNDKLAYEMNEHSYLIQWDAGEWCRSKNNFEKNWSTVSICVCKYPSEQGIYLGAWGEVLCVGSGDVHEESISTDTSSPASRGPLRSVRSIAGQAYAVGMDRQVYRREGSNQWISIDQGARPQLGNTKPIGFDAIDGFSANEIYASGRNGEIWYYGGTIWIQIDSPTDLTLANICCAEDGKVYICGSSGVLLRGRGETWELIEHDLVDDLWGIAWYKGKLYLATRDSLFTLNDNDEIQPVDMGSDKASTCYTLSVADGVLWSIGAKDVIAFDGKQWTRVD